MHRSICRITSPPLTRLLMAALLLSMLPSAALTQSARIGERDLISIQVLEAAEFDGQFRVIDGRINHPILGDLELAGKSKAEAEVLLRQALEAQYLQQGRATVDVDIVEGRSQQIQVVGAVRTPGPLEFTGEWTLLEALAAAGGLASNHGDEIYVFRRAANGLTAQLAVSATRLFQEADPAANIPLSPQDLINVPETVEVTLYCDGQVQTPGAITFKSNERITLLAAIARAGGLTDRAGRKVIIQRQSEDGQPIRIEVDYRAIAAGRRPDEPLQKGDLLHVSRSIF